MYLRVLWLKSALALRNKMNTWPLLSTLCFMTVTMLMYLRVLWLKSTLDLRNKINTYFGQGFIQHNSYEITNQSYGRCQIQLGGMLASKPSPRIARSTVNAA